jgi:hypothetical protein
MSARVSARLVAALAVVLVALPGCSQSASISLSGDTTPSATTEKSATPVAMGQQAWCGDWGILIDSAKRVRSIKGAPAGKGNRLLVIKFEARNGGTRDAGIAASDFTLSDETGATFTPLTFPGGSYLSNSAQTLGSGTKDSFAIVYRVPTTGGPFIWRFAGSGQGAAKPAVLAVQ